MDGTESWPKLHGMTMYEGDAGNEPDDGSYPPDGEDIMEELELMNGASYRPHRANTQIAGVVKQKGPVKANNILVQERHRRALELRKAGASYQAIADALGYSSASGASSAVKSAMGKTLAEPAAELRAVQYERLNHMLMVRWPQVQAGDDAAINTCLRIMDKMDRLMGTDAAQKIEVDANVSGAVIVAGVDRDSYLRAMKSMVIDQQERHTLQPVEIDHAPSGYIDVHVDDIDQPTTTSSTSGQDGSTVDVPLDGDGHVRKTAAKGPMVIDTTPRRRPRQDDSGDAGMGGATADGAQDG